MRTKFKINLNKSKEETIQFLKANHVIISFKNISRSHHVKASWKNLNNPDNFKFSIDESVVESWWGKCSLKADQQNKKTTISIIILPPYFFLFMVGLMSIGIIYSIISFGIHNYGTPGFLPSIIIPSFFVGLMVLIWFLLWHISGRKIRKAILASFNDQNENEIST